MKHAFPTRNVPCVRDERVNYPAIDALVAQAIAALPDANDVIGRLYDGVPYVEAYFDGGCRSFTREQLLALSC